MSTTIADAKAEIVAALTDPAIEGVRAVFDHEPGPGNGLRPLWISLWNAGPTATEWRIEVRVYSDVRNSIKDGQERLDAVLPLIEDALPASVPRSDWDPAFVAGREEGSIDSIIASTVLLVPREDY